MEIQAISLAESGRLLDALAALDRSVLVAPDRASLYNNRAQVLSLLGRQDEALRDLTAAVERAGDAQRRTLRQALCQRGALRRRSGMAEAAREDFERAAKMGSKFARSQVRAER